MTSITVDVQCPDCRSSIQVDLFVRVNKRYWTVWYCNNNKCDRWNCGWEKDVARQLRDLDKK